MSYKRTLIFFSIFAALAIFFYFYEVRGSEARREMENQEELILSFNSDDVIRLVIAKDGQEIKVDKNESAWNITKPVEAPAETNVIERMIDTLAELKQERNLGAQKELGTFGLSEPALEVEVTGHQGEIGRLLIGSVTADDNNIYVKLAGEADVFTTPILSKSRLDKTLFDIRDKTVLDFSPSQVKSVTFSRSGSSFTFESLPENEWLMTSPEERRADSGKLKDLFDAIRFARVRRFVEEKANDFEQYGLQSPSAEIKLEFEERVNSLSLGDFPGTDQERIYARKNDSTQVLELGAEILETLPTTINDWRDKRLVKFDSQDARKVEIQSPSGRVVLERSIDESDEWRLIAPEEGIADEDSVKDFLNALHSSRIGRFLGPDETEALNEAFESPGIEVKLWSDMEEPHFALALARTDDTPVLYARSEDNGEIYEVEERLLETLNVGPDELRDKSALRFKGSDIKIIEVSKNGKLFKIKREEVEWKLPGSLDMESYEIDQFLRDLQEMDFQSIGPKELSDEDYGFDTPILAISLWKADDDIPLQLVIGKEVPNGNSYYVIGRDKNHVTEIDKTTLSEWLIRF